AVEGLNARLSLTKRTAPPGLCPSSWNQSTYVVSAPRTSTGHSTDWISEQFSQMVFGGGQGENPNCLKQLQAVLEGGRAIASASRLCRPAEMAVGFLAFPGFHRYA